MNSACTSPSDGIQGPTEGARLDYLDAVRAFALVLGIVFHASMSFLPFFAAWAIQDVSTSPVVSVFFTLSHSFRMEVFFLIAGVLGHIAFHRKGAGAYLRSRLLRLGIPFVAGWFLLRPLLVSGWIMGSASLQGHYSFLEGIRSGFMGLRSLPAGIFTGTHLWFLYYLCMITGITLSLRGVAGLSGALHEAIARRADGMVKWLAASPVSIPVLAAPTAAALWFMRNWGMDTPDQELRPRLPVLAVYGGFFALGWLLGRQRRLIPQLARLAPQNWLFAATGIGAIQYLGRFELDFVHPHHTAAHAAYALGYALTTWSLVLLTIGIFRTICSRPRAWVRYVADSSYWLYLVHLPIVVWIQVAIADAPLRWSLKLGIVCTCTFLLSLLTYDLFVRSTFVGWILNGTRRDRLLGAWRPVGQPKAATFGLKVLAAGRRPGG